MSRQEVFLEGEFVPIRDEESLKFGAHQGLLVNCYDLYLKSEYE